jgi:hypothetical protein
VVPSSIAVLSGVSLDHSAVWKQRLYGNQVLWNGAVGDDGKLLRLAAGVPEQPPTSCCAIPFAGSKASSGR